MGNVSKTKLSRRSFLTGISATAYLLATPKQLAAQDILSPSPVEIGFCSDMTVHHIQAIAMCQRVLGTDTGGPIQAAASEVLQTQAIEVGMMRAWLVDWGESTKPPSTVMAWMGMNSGNGMPLAMMPGYASKEELQTLSRLNGLAKGKKWLELMRAHHVGGVSMAQAAAEKASLEKVIRMATQQVKTQSFEIEQYDLLLESQYS